jgi:hypothetical protein
MNDESDLDLLEEIDVLFVIHAAPTQSRETEDIPNQRIEYTRHLQGLLHMMYYISQLRLYKQGVKSSRSHAMQIADLSIAR